MLHILLSCAIATIFTNNSYEEAIQNENIHPTIVITISLNLNGGNELILSDGSHWIVNPDDVEISSCWLSPFQIFILPGYSSDYPFTLLNTASQERVQVTPFVSPKRSTAS